MFNVAIIGAGSISERHIIGLQKNPDCFVKAIADLNLELANQRAKEFNIKNSYSDYKELLKDDEIDAVIVATPTFTHKEIIIDALRSGKHVMCEKPPAMNGDEVRECEAEAKKSGKLLMFAFVTRFRNQLQMLKKYIDSGKMGKIISAECHRVNRCLGSDGWFIRREKGGGCLIDSAIHELDNVLYLMGYPKPIAVIASQSFANGDLYERFNGEKYGYRSKDVNKYERNIESAISGFVTLDGGASIYIKSATMLNAVNPGVYIDISGEKAGARLEPAASQPADKRKLLELSDDNYFIESSPLVADQNPLELFKEQTDHFVNCCVNGEESICKSGDAAILMDIISALYKSADTNQPVFL